MVFDYGYIFLIFFIFSVIYVTNSYGLIIVFLTSALAIMSFFISAFTISAYFFPFFFSFMWVFFILFFGAYTRGLNLTMSFWLSSMFIYLGGLVLLSSFSLFWCIVGFELMLLSSLYLLKATSKSDRVLEAVSEMFVWGVIGSVLLLVALTLFYSNSVISSSLSLFISFLVISGFSIKIPLWPFTSWLLKAHVEASTEFSIFLSGFLVKFGVIGLFKVIELLGADYALTFVLIMSTVGIFDAIGRMFSQVDLKRVVALTTVVETNWLTLCLSYNTLPFTSVGVWLIVIHCFTTTLEFYLVEFIYRRYGSRSVLSISGLANSYPNLYKFFVFSTFTIIGLPGTAIFIAKFSFLMLLANESIFMSLVIGFLFLVVIPVFFIKLFLTVSGGSPNRRLNALSDLSLREIIVLAIPLVVVVVFGFFPGII